MPFPRTRAGERGPAPPPPGKTSEGGGGCRLSALRLQRMRLAQLDSDKPHVALSATTAARDTDVNPMLTMENRANIYVPSNSRDLSLILSSC